MSEDTDEAAGRRDDAAGRRDDAAGRRDDAAGRRHHRVTAHPTPGPLNSLQYWTDAKPVWRVALNYLLVWVARVAPFLRWKNWALRRLGVTVGRGVSWGLEATPDVFWPELITLGDDVIVGYDSVILCHEFLQEEYRTGEVVVGDRAMIGAKAVILPGVRIGEDAQVAANSLVTRDVPPGTTVAGVPARPMSSADLGDDGEDGDSGDDGDAGDSGEGDDDGDE